MAPVTFDDTQSGECPLPHTMTTNNSEEEKKSSDHPAISDTDSTDSFKDFLASLTDGNTNSNTKGKTIAFDIEEAIADESNKGGVSSQSGNQKQISQNVEDRRLSLQCQSKSQTLSKRLSTPEGGSSSQSQSLFQRLYAKWTHPSPLNRFYLLFLILPTLASLWYAAAILFPTSWYGACPVLVWTPSAQTRNDDGEFTICPRSSICSEGAFQVFLISVARLTAFASYVVQGLAFASKMHSTIHFLSGTYANYLVPFESLHHVHAFTGASYSILALLHTLAHLIRWGVRTELGEWCGSRVGLSGIFAMLSMALVVFIMSPWGKKMSIGKRDSKNMLAFENRFAIHRVSFWILTIALCFHVKRTRQITLSYL